MFTFLIIMGCLFLLILCIWLGIFGFFLQMVFWILSAFLGGGKSGGDSGSSGSFGGGNIGGGGSSDDY
jgi:hypothetical protein